MVETFFFSFRSDISYTADNNDLLDDDESSKVPILKPLSKLSKSKNVAPSGDAVSNDRLERGESENSLLHLTDDEVFLRKGMDEDGSFREGKYAE